MKTRYVLTTNEEPPEILGPYPSIEEHDSYFLCGGSIQIDKAIIGGGGTISEYEPTEEEIAAALERQIAPMIVRIQDAVQKRLDDFAKTRHYFNSLSCISYESSDVPQFAAEAAYMKSARDATWAKCGEILDAVRAGDRIPPPNYEAIEGELPVLEWP